MIIEKGNLVTMEYGGRFESGEIFDSSMKGGVLKPLVFNVGRMEIIKGLDEGVLGMEEGEEKEIVILPEKGYGEYNIELKKTVQKKALPGGFKPVEGMILMVGNPDGGKIPANIMKVGNRTIILDFNHPLAGKKLIFKVKILSVKKGKTE